MTEFDDGYDSRSFRDPGRDMDNMVAQNAINIMQQMGVDFAPRNQRVNQDWQRQDDFYSQANGNGDYRYSQNQGPVDWQDDGRGRSQAFYGQEQEVYRDDPAYSQAVYRPDDARRPEMTQVAQREYSAERPQAPGQWTRYDFAAFESLNQATSRLEGRSIKEFDRNIDPDVGCARSVSQALSDAYGYNIREVNVRKLEGTLRGLGFTEVSTRDIKPSDVILAYRANTDYSHSAIYMGNGQIFNNDSELGIMRRQSIDKFNSAEFKRFVILRRPPEVPALLR
ncbi:MAG: hypothetical protein IPP57_19370 [Candidatus Obscuribacter sp.]|jgi:hypothetical protein|nr:hypothetical protein [Candidatus Obscuribacter sp.]MBK9620221.1 hypothetical protein [Candidatus Obscuribacter sp.]MBK9772948.1 hypothetical protein [Candidatus Obscuribacter sp.]MBP6351870.1 hypothetical protein [Candidatus Obscuribacter sp.]MBP6594853.1 hypothetical protein [Candidatus Obscuribacter sp.]